MLRIEYGAVQSWEYYVRISELGVLCTYIRAGGAIMIIRTHLYGEKHSYGVTVNTGGAPASGVPLLPVLD